MRKEQIAIIALAGWLTLISVLMILLQHVDFEIFFILFMLGILIFVQFLEPNFVQPRYLQYIRYIISVGIVIFGLIVALKVMEILGFEIVFS
jgi:hypothetical protein